jgi:hypothetical protein
MTWDMPIRPIESGALTDREIKELDAFLLAEDGLENPMDFFTFDGFICAVLSGPSTIMPSEWLRCVWDQEQGEQPPEFTSEKQAKRILSLLIGHANVVAFTLTHGPQYYEPRFYAHKLLKLGFEIAESTVSKYMIRRRGPPSQTWRTFLRNHAHAIAAIDLCVVPTLTFECLFAFLVLGHGRRQLLWFAVTRHPTAEWLAQQIVEAFPWGTAPTYLVRDNDRAYGQAFARRLRTMGIRDRPISPRSPWQNPYVERL